jgi:hypothetical protein
MKSHPPLLRCPMWYLYSASVGNIPQRQSSDRPTHAILKTQSNEGIRDDHRR